LFLDEPTIGLDVIAQHSIQRFLKDYQQRRQTTILLTSHYMKDVAALCQRVVIVAGGRVEYDGSLAGIIDKFSGKKIVTLQFADGSRPEDLSRLGTPIESQWPRVKIGIPRNEVPRILAETLRDYAIEDVSVEDPPLEEVIADLFHQVS
jgi:ABC-2 type transport system ATP-binding protein